MVCCPGDDGQQPLCKPFPGQGQKIGSHKCACEVCDTDPGGIVCCPDGDYCSTPASGPEVCTTGAGCETAFAIDPNNFVKFCGNSDLVTNRWGWTNGPYTDANAGSPVSLKIYAGAGGCVPEKGTEVGEATVTVAVDTVTVTVTPTTMMFEFTELHIQVSCEPLKYALTDYSDPTSTTVAPGQYTYGDAFATPVVFVDGLPGSGEFKIDPTAEACTGGYWVIIHAVSCPL